MVLVFGFWVLDFGFGFQVWIKNRKNWICTRWSCIYLPCGSIVRIWLLLQSNRIELASFVKKHIFGCSCLNLVLDHWKYVRYTYQAQYFILRVHFSICQNFDASCRVVPMSVYSCPCNIAKIPFKTRIFKIIVVFHWVRILQIFVQNLSWWFKERRINEIILLYNCLN